MKTLLEKLNDIRPCLGALDLALVFENCQTRDGKIHLRLEFVSLEVIPSKQSIKFLSHALNELSRRTVFHTHTHTQRDNTEEGGI